LKSTPFLTAGLMILLQATALQAQEFDIGIDVWTPSERGSIEFAAGSGAADPIEFDDDIDMDNFFVPRLALHASVDRHRFEFGGYFMTGKEDTVLDRNRTFNRTTYAAGEEITLHLRRNDALIGYRYDLDTGTAPTLEIGGGLHWMRTRARITSPTNNREDDTLNALYPELLFRSELPLGEDWRLYGNLSLAWFDLGDVDVSDGSIELGAIWQITDDRTNRVLFGLRYDRGKFEFDKGSERNRMTVARFNPILGIRFGF
jgi:hypothetical protein